MRHFLLLNVTPRGMVDALEDLIAEQLLPAAVARQIEEAVLRMTHGSGLWR